MESIPQPVIKLGLKIFIDTGEVLIQLGETLIPYSSLPAGFQKAIEAVLEGSAKAVTGAAMNPLMLAGFAFALFTEYRRARSDQREQEANQRAEQANQQAREANHQSEEARQRAQEAYHQAEAAHQRAQEHEQEVREAREELERYASSRVLIEITNDDHRRYIRGVEIAVQISAEDIPDFRRQCALGEIGITQNIAVVGRVSSGKTTFINDCRGLRFSQVGPQGRDKEYQLGEVGNEETTQHRQLYRDIAHEQIFWWDMPGIGGQSQREWNYYSTFNLSLYDRLLILHDKPFSQTEYNIVRMNQESQVPNPPRIAIIRTKSDESLKNIRRDQGLEGDELISEFKINNVRKVRSFLSQGGLRNDVDIYHISSDALYKAITGHGEGNITFIDELQLLHDLGINAPSTGLSQDDYTYDGSPPTPSTPEDFSPMGSS